MIAEGYMGAREREREPRSVSTWLIHVTIPLRVIDRQIDSVYKRGLKRGDEVRNGVTLPNSERYVIKRERREFKVRWRAATSTTRKAEKKSIHSKAAIIIWIYEARKRAKDGIGKERIFSSASSWMEALGSYSFHPQIINVWSMGNSSQLTCVPRQPREPLFSFSTEPSSHLSPRRVNRAWLMIDFDVSIKAEWSRTFPPCSLLFTFPSIFVIILIILIIFFLFPRD